MSLHKQLIKSAEAMEANAELLEKAAEAVEKLSKVAADAAKAPKAAKPQEKTAAEKARTGQLAKAASDNLLKAGFLSNQEQADVFANAIMNDHDVAISQLAKFAGCAHAPKLGEVVVDDTMSVSSDDANSVYEKTAFAHLQRLNIKA